MRSDLLSDLGGLRIAGAHIIGCQWIKAGAIVVALIVTLVGVGIHPSSASAMPWNEEQFLCYEGTGDSYACGW